MFHILPSDGRVPFFGILVSNFQYRREQNFLGVASVRETKFYSLFFMRYQVLKSQGLGGPDLLKRLCH